MPGTFVFILCGFWGLKEAILLLRLVISYEWLVQKLLCGDAVVRIHLKDFPYY